MPKIDQGQAAGKNLWVNVTEETPSQCPDVLSGAKCCLAGVSRSSFRMVSQQQILVYPVGRLLV